VDVVSGFDHLRRDLALASPAPEQDVARLREDYGQQVPDDYLTFLSEHNGASGAIGILDPAADVGLGSERNPELYHLDTLVLFGSTGGGEAFAFDPMGQVVLIPWIGDLTDAIPQGTFHGFLSRLLEDRLYDPIE
jgi:hypothetical protein